MKIKVLKLFVFLVNGSGIVCGMNGFGFVDNKSAVALNHVQRVFESTMINREQLEAIVSEDFSCFNQWDWRAPNLTEKEQTLSEQEQKLIDHKRFNCSKIENNRTHNQQIVYNEPFQMPLNMLRERSTLWTRPRGYTVEQQNMIMQSAARQYLDGQLSLEVFRIIARETLGKSLDEFLRPFIKS